jgi:hypothetical protein
MRNALLFLIPEGLFSGRWWPGEYYHKWHLWNLFRGNFPSVPPPPPHTLNQINVWGLCQLLYFGKLCSWTIDKRGKIYTQQHTQTHTYLGLKDIERFGCLMPLFLYIFYFSVTIHTFIQSVTHNIRWGPSLSCRLSGRNLPGVPSRE